MGFMLETLPDVSYEAISDAYASATKDPIGVGQAQGFHVDFLES